MVTNCHVIRNAKDIVVYLPNMPCMRGVCIGVQPGIDVAVLKLEQASLHCEGIAKQAGSKRAPLKTGSPARLCQDIWAVGSPNGLLNSFSKGVVSALNRSIEGKYGKLCGLIQHDAATNFGSSGGPLLNNRHEVIGMNLACQRASQGIFFAIPIATVCAAMSRILER